MAYVGKIMIHEPNSNITKLLTLEVALEYFVKQVASSEGRDYDPEGFHEGPRKGKYFKPGEREAGGPEVDIVQAPNKFDTSGKLKEQAKAIQDRQADKLEKLNLVSPDNITKGNYSNVIKWSDAEDLVEPTFLKDASTKYEELTENRELYNRALALDLDKVTVWHGTTATGATGIYESGAIHPAKTGGGFGVGFNMSPKAATHWAGGSQIGPEYKDSVDVLPIVIQFDIDVELLKDITYDQSEDAYSLNNTAINVPIDENTKILYSDEPDNPRPQKYFPLLKEQFQGIPEHLLKPKDDNNLSKQQGVYSGSNIPPEKRFYHDSGKHQGPRGGRFSEIGVDVDQHGKPLEQQLENVDPEVGEEREVSVVAAPESKEKSSEDSTLDSILSDIDLTEYSLADKRREFSEYFRIYITKATSGEHGNNSESMRQIVQYAMDKLNIAQGGPEVFLSPEDGGLGPRTNFLSRVAEDCPIDMFGEFSERVKQLTEDVGDRWGEWNRLRFDWDESNPPKFPGGFPMDYSRVASAEESWRDYYDGLSNIVSTIEDRQRILNFIPEGVADRFSDFALNFDDKMPGSIKIFPDLDDWPEMKEEIKGSFGEFGEFTVVNNPTEAIIEIIDELYKGTKYGKTHSYTKNEWERSSNSNGAFLLKESIGRQLDGPMVYHQDVDFAESSDNIMEGGLDEEEYIEGIFSSIVSSTPVSDFTSRERIDNYVLLHKRVNRELMDYVFPQDEFEIFRGINDEDLSNDLMSRTDDKDDVDARFDDIFYPVEDSISQNPVSSYSLNYRTALSFASRGDDRGAVIRTTVHKDDVWSSFLSHAIHGNEYEMLVIGDSSRPTVAGSYVDLYQNRNSEDYYLENRGIVDIPRYMYSREDSEEIQKAGRDKDKKIIIDAGENGDWIKIVRDMTKKDKDTNNLSKLLTLEVALEYMANNNG